MSMTITLIIIIITALVSISAFSNEKIYNDLIFYPPAVSENRQWYRFFSSGLIHADWMHLIFNMYTLYSFGEYVEGGFGYMFQEKGKLLYLLMYISAFFFSLLPTYLKNKDNGSYRSLGASGAVSAVIFAFILFNPMQRMFFGLPSFLFGFIYLIISSVLDKRNVGNINHSAHIWGALYGVSFLIITGYALSDYPVLASFIAQIRNYLHL